ncbi:DegT/DnrJ/EryC1/StrS family aminotransferase [Chitinimonas sp.]|uniref:DegT/DnrJ/EryC1/StrS family aminotransferase n=1 Tax=Chitinimonas sp. TaxID=1934313 RepID=UPI0035AEA836
MSVSIPLFKVYTPPGAGTVLEQVLASGRLATGPQVAAFEGELAQWLGVQDVVAISDASAALTLALYQAGVRPGDEVITSPLACAASLMPIANLFARPVWADIDPASGMIDVAKLNALYSSRTRAVLLYHWSGNVGNVAAIAASATQHGVALVQDASEAWGAQLAGRYLGSEADFTVYSFYATKHLSCGEGAALLARKPADLLAARRLRRFGIDYAGLRLPSGDLDPALDIPLAGFNMPMNELAAALGRQVLPHMDGLLAKYAEHAGYYQQMLANCPGVQLLVQQADSRSAWWTYSLRVERREALVAKLVAAGIGAQRLHIRGDCYRCFAPAVADLPGVTQFDGENLSIPCGWWLSGDDCERIVRCIQAGW